MKLVLLRERPQPSHDCTLGALIVGDQALVSLERPWIPSTKSRGGLKGQSCVPLGTYQLVRHNSPKHPETWALVNPDLDVLHYEGDDHDPDEDRTTCLLHPAAFVEQLEGCIAPGMYTTRLADGRFMVSKSREAFALIKLLLTYDDSHSIEIREAD